MVDINYRHNQNLDIRYIASLTFRQMPNNVQLERVKASLSASSSALASLILVSLISRAIFDISSFKFELNVFWYASSNANSIYPTDIFRCTLPPRNPAVVWVNYRDNAVELSGCA